MSSVAIDLDNLKEKMIRKLQPSGWAYLLSSFIRSAEMSAILEALIEDSNTHGRMTPALKDIFRPFELCPLEKLHAVFIGGNPYVQEGVADGLLFSCGKTMEVNKSLSYVLQEVNRTMYPHLTNWEAGGSPDLSRWAEQGVLLLNSALTCRIGEGRAHMELWRPFIENVLLQLKHWHPHNFYVFLGQYAHGFAPLIEDQVCPKYLVEHPQEAIAGRKQSWDSQGIFQKINNYVFDFDNTEIHW